MENQKLYQEAATHALAGFQMAEESLKNYITAYHQVVQKYLPNNIVYRHGRSEVEDMALGKLIEVFAKKNDNLALIEKLRKMKQVRDTLAHKAFTKLYGPQKQSFKFIKSTEEFIDTANNLGLILDEILKEYLKLSAI